MDLNSVEVRPGEPLNPALRFGTILTTAQPPDTTAEDVFDNAVESAKLAEKLGYDDAWLLEHHFTRFGLCPDTIDMAGYLLGATRRLSIGSAIVQVPLHHPLKLAERVAQMDQLSNGRYLFGIGRGDFTPDFEVFGFDIAKSAEMLRESWAIIKQAWSGPVSSTSEFWQTFEGVEVVPKPRSRPRPPMFAAATSPKSVEWAASQGIPLMLIFYIEDQVKKSIIDLYSDVAAEHGHDPSPSQHIISCVAHVGDTTEQARVSVRDRFLWWATESDRAEERARDRARRRDAYSYHYTLIQEEVLKGKQTQEEGYLDKLYRLNPVGSVDRCIGRLQEQIDLLGIGHIIVGFEGAGDANAVSEQMTRFAHEIAPQLQPNVRTSALRRSA